jgi:ParB family chromosome partitioning protein
MSNGLGRGLNSLIPQKNQKSIDDNNGQVIDLSRDDSSDDKVLQIETDKVLINPMQPRKKFEDHQMDELVESIKEYGIIQPLIVSKKDGNYELIAGERRLRAAKQIGLETVPVIIRKVEDQEKLEVALIENIQRENLNPIEMAEGYKKLIDDFSMTQEEVAKKVGKSRSSVTNALRYLNLPEEIRLALINDKITEGHAKYLVGLEGEDRQMSLFRKIIHNNLTVSDTNNEARKMGGTKAARIKINYDDKAHEFAFREFFGAKAEIKRKGKGGQVIINFYSDDELNEITNKIK